MPGGPIHRKAVAYHITSNIRRHKMRKIIIHSRLHIILIRIEPKRTAKPRIHTKKSRPNQSGRKERSRHLLCPGSPFHLSLKPETKDKEKSPKPQRDHKPNQKHRKGKACLIRKGHLLIPRKTTSKLLTPQLQNQNPILPNRKPFHRQSLPIVSLIQRINPLQRTMTSITDLQKRNLRRPTIDHPALRIRRPHMLPRSCINRGNILPAWILRKAQSHSRINRRQNHAHKQPQKHSSPHDKPKPFSVCEPFFSPKH